MAPSRAGAALLLCLAATSGLLAPAAVFAQAEKDDKPEIVDLRFRGVESLKLDELRKSIVTDESHCKSFILKPLCWITKPRYIYEREYLDREELVRDMLRMRVFYWKRGYRETQVDTVIAPRGNDKVGLTFLVDEGPPTIVSDVTITQTNPVLSGRTIAQRTMLRRGEPLNMIKLDSMRVRLEGALWDRGYADAIVDTVVSVTDDGLSASVAVNLNPRWLTTIAEIHVHGNEKVSPRTIRRSLTFRERDLFRRSELLRSQRNLYESNLFRRAVIELSVEEETGVDSTKIVDITVQESPPREARVSFGFTTADFVQTEGRYTHYNFTGGARRLTVTGAVGNLLAEQLNNKLIFTDNYVNVGSDRGRYFAPTYNASAELQQPWFGSARNALALSVFTHRRSAPGIYIDRGYGSSATFTREVALRAPASLNYRFEVTTVEAGDVYFCVNFGVCDRPTLDALRRHQRISPLTLTGNIDRTNDPFSPNRGYRGRTALEHASGFTASDYRYNRAVAEAAAFLAVRRRGVLGGHVRLGWVKGVASTGEALGGLEGEQVLHPRTRFFAGGAQSVRGFGENQLGPRVLTISAAQLRGGTGPDDAPACPEATPITDCDPNMAAYRDKDFQPRPLGGNTVAEASVELRFPVWKQLSGAAFIDAGVVTQNIDRSLPGSRAAITPGFGIRYQSPVGPIRVDIGINPGRAEQLPVISEEIVDGERRLVRLTTRREYAVARGGFKGVLDRMVLHLSIGEAF